MKSKKIKFLFKVWKGIKKKVKTVYVVKETNVEGYEAEQLKVVEWEDVENFLNDLAVGIENENKTIKKNSSN